jgi:hypothetical protein
VAGLNPYQQANIDREYRRAGGVPIDAQSLQSLPTVFAPVYPPSTFVLVSTLAGTDWKTAKIVWMTINTLSFLASILLLLKSAYNRSRQLALYLLAFCLLFAPVQTGIAKGQPSVLAICLLTAALYLPVFPRRDLIAGLLVGLSCCIKPQIALPFFLYWIWRRQWGVIGASIGVVILAWAVALPSLIHGSPTWASDWLSTLQSATGPGTSFDPTFRNVSTYQLVNFQSAVGFFTDKTVVCNLVTYALIAGLIALILALKHPLAQQPWLILGLLPVLILFGSYHRYYDLQLLLLCIGGLVLVDWSGRRGLLGGLLAVVACLSVPLQAAAARAYSLPSLGDKLKEGGRTLQFIALHHQPCCLLAIALMFAWLIVVSPSGQYAGSGAKPPAHEPQRGY